METVINIFAIIVFIVVIVCVVMSLDYHFRKKVKEEWLAIMVEENGKAKFLSISSRKIYTVHLTLASAKTIIEGLKYDVIVINGGFTGLFYDVKILE